MNQKTEIKKTVFVIGMILLIICIIFGSIFGYNLYKEKHKIIETLSFELDNTQDSLNKKTNTNPDNSNVLQNQNIDYKTTDFKLKLDIPVEMQAVGNISNIPVSKEENYFYEFDVLQNTGTDNIVLYKFYIYDIEEYNQMSDYMKEKHYLVKRFDEYGYCLTYETMPVNHNIDEKLWEEYQSIYKSLPSIIDSITIKK